MKFKTNAKCGGCSATILAAIRVLFPQAEASLDLSSPDKVLSISGISESAETVQKIIKAISGAGFHATQLL